MSRKKTYYEEGNAGSNAAALFRYFNRHSGHGKQKPLPKNRDSNGPENQVRYCGRTLLQRMNYPIQNGIRKRNHQQKKAQRKRRLPERDRPITEKKSAYPNDNY